MKKVLYVITDSGVGGSEKIITNLIENLDQKKYKPCAVIILKSKREMALRWEKSIPVFALNMGRVPTPGLLLQFNKLVKEIKPDFVHAFLFHAVQLCRLNHFFNKSYKLISSPRVNYRFAPFIGLLVDNLLRRIDDYVVSESTQSKKFLVNRLGYKADHISVIQNGVDPQKFSFSSSHRDRVRNELGLKEGDVCIAGVGRLHHQKGFDVLIDAAKHLKPNPNSHQFFVLGGGEEEQDLKLKAKKDQVSIEFLGQRDDVDQFLSAVDIFVLSSRYEGMPNALLEAMSVGVSCVSTAVDGVMDIARDGENIILSKPEDALSLSVGIGVLLEKPNLRKTIAENGKKTANQHSSSKMVSDYESIYDMMDHHVS